MINIKALDPQLLFLVTILTALLALVLGFSEFLPKGSATDDINFDQTNDGSATTDRYSAEQNEDQENEGDNGDEKDNNNHNEKDSRQNNKCGISDPDFPFCGNKN